MSLHLDGSTQYYDLGLTDVRSQNPITVAFVGRIAAGTTGVRSPMSQGQYNNDTGWGFFSYSGDPHRLGSWSSADGAATTEIDGAENQIPEDTWVLFIGTFFTTAGINFFVKWQVYNFTTGLWSTQEKVLTATGKAHSTMTVPGGAEHTFIGAGNINTGGSTPDRFWKGDIAWIAVFDNAIGGDSGEIKDSAFAAELVENGFWNSIDSSCKLAISFHNTTEDHSSNAYTGTLIGSPSYGDTGPGEVNASGPITYDQAIDLSVTTALTIQKTISKKISFVVTMTIALIRLIQHIVTFSITESLAITREVRKSISFPITVTLSAYRKFFSIIAFAISGTLSASWQAVENVIKALYRNILSISLRSSTSDTTSIKDTDDATL